jgi:adenylate cyclase
MLFRIGVNLGDVLVEGDDLFGEGVNIAARLQSLAEPGGILVSGSVFDQVRNKLTLSFDFLGPQSVKNIAEAVPAWRVVLEGAEGDGARARRADDRSADERRVMEVGTRRGSAPARGDYRLRSIGRLAAIAAVLVSFFFAIDVFSGSHAVWFQWPSLAIVVIVALRIVWVYFKE